VQLPAPEFLGVVPEPAQQADQQLRRQEDEQEEQQVRPTLASLAETGRLQEEVVEKDAQRGGEDPQGRSPPMANEDGAQQVDGKDQGEVALPGHQPG
jgi:hypothetical protein